MAAAATTGTMFPKQKEMKGLLLGRYEIGKLLGHGTFAKVYHARNVKTGEIVAIKIKQTDFFILFAVRRRMLRAGVLARKGYDAAKVDIWSCGVILFVLMAGYLPFQDQNVMAMYKKIYKGEFRFLGGFRLIDSIVDPRLLSLSESESEFETRRKITSLPRPASLNAFDIIRFHVVSIYQFYSEEKDCRVSLEGSRDGEKGPLTIAAEIFELTPSLRVVEVKKKSGERLEYEQFYNSELKPGLQSLGNIADSSYLPSDTEI
ncbi:hypothetical protein BUALT_Bualt03G0044300 [Buddleja alternifolia]|uniref:Protein kinase domain-containing protein n=1 Tax=Buddleja alternifolia TaxID=168488 RepID=A0AAV6XSI7_9LAMI|nr:hypothetical protein BUALT_Bualt03G0044300 [Buddleja alternifolia]